MFQHKKNSINKPKVAGLVAAALGLILTSASAFSATPLTHPNSYSSSAQKAVGPLDPTEALAPGTSEAQLNHRVSVYLAGTAELTFRDITPTFVADDVRHLQQTYQGVDLDKAVIAVRLDPEGNITRVYGTAYEGLGLDLASQTQASAGLALRPTTFDARHIAANYLQTLEADGNWHISQWGQTSVIGIIDGQARQVVRLLFYAEHLSAGKFTRPLLLLDAFSGEILNIEETLQLGMQAGSGPGGNLMTGIYRYNWLDNAIDALSAGTFLVTRSDTECVMQIEPVAGSWQNNVMVINGKNTSAAYRYPCSDEEGLHEEDLSSQTGAYSPLNDASYSAQVAFNLYENFAITQAKGPLNEIGRPLIVKARYGFVDNAFWNGEFIALGDGARYFYPEVSADTLGHELAHAFLAQYTQTSQTGGLSMGVSESFADIAGEATEYAIRQKAGAENDWKHGGETFKPTLEDAARYFERPSTDGRSIDTPKDWNSEIRGHHLAGPFNKAFFHLVTDNKSRGWTPLIGFDLWLTAATNCWVPRIDYVAAAQCIVDSVASFRQNNTTLPSDWSAEQIRYAVMRAFAQVDIMTQTETGLVALFDYEHVFDTIRLTNVTSVPGNTAPEYEWDINDDGSVETRTQDRTHQIDLVGYDKTSSVVVKLSATDNQQQDEYSREIHFSPSYCKPSGFYGSPDYISQVSLNGSPFPATELTPGGYADYTALLPVSLSLTEENTFSFTPNDDSNTRRWVIFVDLNGDHDFDDDGETIVDVSRKGALTVPAILNGPGLENLGQTTRMRVLMEWLGTTQACHLDIWGEAEDYRVTLVDNLESVPSPVVGYSYVMPETGYTVAFNNSSTEVPNGATWSWQVKGINEPNYTEFATTHSATYDFETAGVFQVRLILTTALGEYPTEQSITLTGPDDYCLAGRETTGVYIENVGIHHRAVWSVLDNSTDGDGGYSLYGSDLIKKAIPRGELFYMNVNVVGQTSEDKNIGIWLDIDQNKIFDEEERIAITTNNRNPSTTWVQHTIPTDAMIGLTRLRVIVTSGSGPDACGLISAEEGTGEVEDYTVEIE
jgi:Zn-dependent metalloprotease